MLKFFRLFDSKEKAAREALARSAEYGASTKKRNEFLDQVVLVREFFAPFLEKKQGPMLDFRLQFRVNGDHEIGANQIIDWKLDVGKKKFAYLSDDLEGRWVFGDPIRLTLRWANNSPVVPVTSALPVPVKAKDRIATFSYDDHWSLFTMLLRHGPMLKRVGTQAECDQSFDSRTLHTEIHRQNRARSGRAAAAAFGAENFRRGSVHARQSREGQQTGTFNVALFPKESAAGAGVTPDRSEQE